MIAAKTMGANVMSRGYRMSKHLFPVVVLTALSTAASAQIPTMNQMWRTNRDMAIQQQQQMLDDMRLQQQDYMAHSVWYFRLKCHGATL